MAGEERIFGEVFGFVEMFDISHIDRLAIMRFKGEQSRTIVPLENVYVLVKD